MKKQLILRVILLMTLIITITGCGKKVDTPSTKVPTNEVESTTSESFTIEDMAGREITFDKVPEKMVALLASDVEILYRLGVEEKIIAVGEFCNYPSEALEKEKITTGESLNIEQIVALQPDVVIIGKMAQTKDQNKKLEDAGIKVFVTDANSIEETYQSIDLLGKISGKSEEATKLIDDMKSDIQTIRNKASEKASNKTIYFEVSPLVYGLWTTGKDTYMQELCDIVGAKNIFSDVTGWTEVSEEQVIDRNPDYILTVTMFYEDGMTPTEEILSRKNWSDITAIKNQGIISDETDMFTRPGPRVVDAAKTLYELLYREE